MQLYQLDATGLLEALARRDTSSVEIVQALIARRHAVDGQLGAFVARLDEQALAAAAAADAERQRAASPSDLPPLHGLPLTIKDNIDVAGTDSTMGLRARQGQPAAQDAVVVQQLRRCGAIVLGKTNVPQLLLVQESDNEVFGVTRNPWNLQRTPGGSSGGEAAAIASGQTPLGIGTDIGGSLRIPGHFAGICAFKPTVDRWSMRGCVGPLPGQELVRAQMGPMARSMRDIWLVMRALDPVVMNQVDATVPPLPIGAPTSVRGLRIGVFTDDGFVTPAPSIVRAVRRAADALRAQGAIVVEYAPPNPDLITTWLAGLSSDGGRTLTEQLTSDRICAQLRPTFLMTKVPKPLRLLAAEVLARRGDVQLAKLLRAIGDRNITDYWRLCAERSRMRQDELDAWQRQNLDAVICPPHVLPALPLGASGDLVLSLTYVFRYVMLNFPCGVVPVTKVRSDETTAAFPPGMLGNRLASALAGSTGLPIGVQVVARPFREDLALSVSTAIETGVHDDSEYPRTPIDPGGQAPSAAVR